MINILKNGSKQYRPVEIKSSINSDGEVVLTAQNATDGILSGVGIFLSKAKNLGEGVKPGDFDGHIDYNNLIEWGNKAERLSVYGGLVLIKDNGTEIYFSSKNGSSRRKKIKLGTLAIGESVRFTLRMEVPTNVSSRRLYVAVNVE